MSLSTVDFINQIILEIKGEEGFYGESVSWCDLEDELENREIAFEEVHTSFEEGGRWYNYYEHVVKINDEYIQISETVPASEIQEDQGDGIVSVIRVFPKQITTTVYVTKLKD